MAKKSIILHLDSLLVLYELSDEQAGKLFKAILNYHSENFDENSLDQITKLIFIPFKNQFSRDNEKYEIICERNKINGLKGGRPITQQNQNNPSGFLDNPTKPKKADSKKDSNNKKYSENDSKNVSEIIDDIYSLYPANCPKRNSSTGKNKNDKTKIGKLLTQYSESDLKLIIENYLKDCESSNTYLKNFGTFLNNLPVDLLNKQERPKSDFGTRLSDFMPAN